MRSEIDKEVYVSSLLAGLKTVTNDYKAPYFPRENILPKILIRRGAGSKWIEQVADDLIARRYAPSGLRITPIPKPNRSYRPGAMLSLRDHATMSSNALLVAGIVQNAISDTQGLFDLGYLIRKDRDNGQLFYETGKSMFNRSVKDLYAPSLYLVVTDVERCFESISIDLVRYCLGKYAVPNLVFESLLSSLYRWQVHDKSKGLPQNCSASQLLVKLLFHEIDTKCLELGVYPLRFVDDYRLISLSYANAVYQLETLRSVLADFGLRLNLQKTLIVTGEKAMRIVNGEEWGSIEIDRYINDAVDYESDIVEYGQTAFIGRPATIDWEKIYVEELRQGFGPHTKYAVSNCIKSLTEMGSRVAIDDIGYHLETSPFYTEALLEYSARIQGVDIAADVVSDLSSRKVDQEPWQVRNGLNFVATYSSDRLNSIIKHVLSLNPRDEYLRRYCLNVLGNNEQDVVVDLIIESFDYSYNEDMKAESIWALRNYSHVDKKDILLKLSGGGILEKIVSQEAYRAA